MSTFWRCGETIRAVLTQGVRLRGTTFSAAGYRDLTGNPGEMQGTLAVFRKTGQPCVTCGTAIERLIVGGRSTHICSVCQVAPLSREQVMRESDPHPPWHCRKAI